MTSVFSDRTRSRPPRFSGGLPLPYYRPAENFFLIGLQLFDDDTVFDRAIVEGRRVTDLFGVFFRDSTFEVLNAVFADNGDRASAEPCARHT